MVKPVLFEPGGSKPAKMSGDFQEFHLSGLQVTHPSTTDRLPLRTSQNSVTDSNGMVRRFRVGDHPLGTGPVRNERPRAIPCAFCAFSSVAVQFAVDDYSCRGNMTCKARSLGQS